MTALLLSSEVEPVRVVHAPPAPRSIAETGLDPGFLVDLMAKTIYPMGLERPSDIGREMKLPAALRGRPHHRCTERNRGNDPHISYTEPHILAPDEQRSSHLVVQGSFTHRD